MERRSREARENSLKELKRLRLEGVAKKLDTSGDDSDVDVKDLLRVYSSDEEFIEYHLPKVDSGQEMIGQRQATTSVARPPEINVKEDEFFSSVIAQLDADDGDEMALASEMNWDEPLPEFPTITSSTTFNAVNSEPDLSSSVANVNMDAIKLNVQEESSSMQDSALFYWIDAHERPNGIVFLFGLARDSPDAPLKSACLMVKNVQRNVYLLPRETIDNNQSSNSMELVRAEVDALLASHKIVQSSVSLRVVSRKYAFEVPGIPAEADWVKITYPYSQPAINITSGRTFSHVFGAHCGPLEMFIVKRKLMGPSWLSIKSAHCNKTGLSWCGLEFQVESGKQVFVHPSPPLTPEFSVLSLKLCCVPVTKGHYEIVAAAGVVFKHVSLDSSNNSQDCIKASSAFSVVREDGPNQSIPCTASSILAQYGKGKLEVAKSERALLSYLIAIIHRWDPDVIVGHNLLSMELSVLLQRLRHHQTNNWSRIGRLHWSHWPRLGGRHDASFAERQILSGRLICDTLLGAREHVRSKNYTLSTLAESQLGVKDHKPFNMDSLVYNEKLPVSARMVVDAIKSAESDAFLQAQLAFRLHLLTLSKQLTNIAGNLWNRTLMGGRAERNEYLFLHEFHNLKYILPDKRSFKDFDYNDVDVGQDHHYDGDDEQQQIEKGGGSRRKPMYSGGLVLEPKRGFYTNIVMLLDFNSLYPSLIQEFNICFTTVERTIDGNEIPQIPDPNLPQGILPRIIHNLVQRRRQVKSLLKDPKLSMAERAQLNIRQQALKLTANSMYGCLGFTHSRFHARSLAALITAKGREVLQNTVNLATSQLNLDVIYGDTDSVMINTNLQDPVEAKALSIKLKKAVNEKYKCLEIELDALFRRLLLLKKKKYAALKIQDGVDSGSGVACVLETKGLDMVRRDWCALSVEACNFCLEQMMAVNENSVQTDLSAIIHKYLIDLNHNISSNLISVDKYVISKNLTKDPSLYPDTKGQPHVAVAMRLKDKGESMHSGVTIQYVICKANQQHSASMCERAFHVDEVKKDPTLVIDKEWYIQQQLIPPLGRICEFVPGVDQAFLASAFNLDIRKYIAQHPSSSFPHSSLQQFKDCGALVFDCVSCGKQFEFTRQSTATDNKGLGCPHCSALLSPTSALYQLLAVVRRLQNEFYQQQGQCDECGTKSRCIRIYPQRCSDDECLGSVNLMVASFLC